MCKQADDALVMHLAGGNSVEGAAQLAGVSRATAFRRLQNPEFKQRIADARAEMLDRTFGNLSQGSVEACVVLRNLLLNGSTEKIKLGAAALLLGNVLKVRESLDLAEQVAELKAAVEALQLAKKSRRTG